MPTGLTSSGPRVTGRGLEITRKFKGRLVDIQHFEISTDLKTLTLSISQATDRKPRSILVFGRA